MRLRTRILLALSAALIPLLLVGTVGVVALRTGADQTERAVEELTRESALIIRTRDQMIKAEYWAMQYVSEGVGWAKPHFDRLARNIDHNLDTISRFDGADERLLGARAESHWATALDLARGPMSQPPGSADERSYPLDEFHEPIAEAIGIMTDLNLASIRETKAQAAAASDRALLHALIFGAVFVIASLALAVLARRLGRGINRPLRSLEQAAILVGNDQFDHRVEIDSDDELGRLGRAFNTMAERLSHSRDELRQAQKMEALGQLAGGVAHDFNNQLTIIKNYADFIAEDLPPGSRQAEDLDEIRRAASRASSLSEQLLTFARKSVVRPEVINPMAMLQGLEAMLSRLLAGKISVRVKPCSHQAQVLIDRSQLEQVLMNLAINAKDAMPNGGTLTLSCGITHRGPLRPRSSLVISVADTGVGMTPEVRDRVFEPFYTTKPAGGGTGLGLATSQRIVQRAGGEITVSSEPGRGSRFDVYLPLLEISSPTDTAPAEEPAASTRPARILVVEDEDAVRRLVIRVLERSGHEVIAAASGRDGLEIFEARPDEIDLIVTDVIMPGMSGKELAERARTVRSDIPILLMSGHIDEINLSDEVLQREDLGFIAKPFTTEALLLEIELRLPTLTGKAREKP